MNLRRRASAACGPLLRGALRTPRDRARQRVAECVVLRISGPRFRRRTISSPQDTVPRPWSSRGVCRTPPRRVGNPGLSTEPPRKVEGTLGEPPPQAMVPPGTSRWIGAERLALMGYDLDALLRELGALPADLRRAARPPRLGPERGLGEISSRGSSGTISGLAGRTAASYT